MRDKLQLTCHALRHDHERGTNARHRREHRFDFTEFDAMAVDLHLMVFATEILERTVHAPARQITGAIAPAAGRVRIRLESLARQLRPAMISRSDLHATDPQQPGHAGRHRSTMHVEHMQLRVRDRASDRNHTATCPCLAGPRRHIDGRFRRPVQIVERHVSEHLLCARHDRRRQRLAAGEELPQRAPR